MESANRLAGKIAIISGAASGIGAETARVFAAQGAKVLACDVNEADGNAQVEAINAAGGGSIVNISSICGIVGSHSNAAYHASKGAVRILSKAAAIQYAADGVRVNSIHPGFIDTAMTRPAHDNNAIAKARMDATPLGRFGQPADIAMGCTYLASDESSFVTGTELVIDGGMVAN